MPATYNAVLTAGPRLRDGPAAAPLLNAMRELHPACKCIMAAAAGAAVATAMAVTSVMTAMVAAVTVTVAKWVTAAVITVAAALTAAAAAIC